MDIETFLIAFIYAFPSERVQLPAGWVNLHYPILNLKGRTAV